MKLRDTSVAHHAPNENLQRPLHHLDSRHILPAVGPDPVVMAAGDFEEAKRRPAIEKLHPQRRMVRFFFVGFGEIQPPAPLVHGKPGLHPELERLQLQTGLQTPVGGG